MIRVLIVLALAGTATTAAAHTPSDAHLRLAIDGEVVRGRLDVALRDLDAALALDGDGDGALTWGEVTAAAPRITAYVEQRLAIAGDDRPCALVLGPLALADLADGAYAALAVTATCPTPPAMLVLTYRLLFDVDAQHRGLVHAGEQVVIVREPQPVRIAGAAGGGFAAFVREGVWHIWIGLDHVLFLLCLVLPAVAPRRQPAASLRAVAGEVLAIVTAFTLAHSITLVISAVGLVTLPPRIAETAIAASVVAAALNNLVRVVDARWAVAFALGLLHGFGFSSVLLDLGLPSSQLVTSLLGFNLGVELGQAAIVACVLPLLYAIRRTLAYAVVLWAGSGCVAMLAAAWTYQRWVA